MSEERIVPNYKVGVDYYFVDFGEDRNAIVIMKEPYNEVVYCYDKVSLDENEERKLVFTYNIINTGDHSIDMLKDDIEFKTLIGDILVNIIEGGMNGEVGKDNSEESDIQP